MSDKPSGWEKVYLDAFGKVFSMTFISPNECDSNGESANIVDGLFAIARSIYYFADVVQKAGDGDVNG